MTEINTIFRNKIKLILELSDEQKFANCESICTYLIQLGCDTQDKNNVYLFEVLEAIFRQIKEPLFNYDNTKDEQKKLTDVFNAHLNKIFSHYEDGNFQEVYKDLIELRYIVSIAQFSAREQKTSRMPYEYGGVE